MSIAPIVINGNTFVPLRFVSEATGNVVNWDSQAHTVSIKSSGAATVTKQFGGASYGKDVGYMGSMEFVEDSGNLYLWKKDGWMDEITYSLSVGTKDAWAVTDKTIVTIPKEGKDSRLGDMRLNTALFVRNQLIIRDEQGIRQIVVSPKGEITSDTYIVKMPRKSSEMFKYISTGDDEGFMIGTDNTTNFSVYLLNDIANPVTFTDKKRRIYVNDSYGGSDYFYVKSKKQIYFTSNWRVKAFDTANGDMIYDNDGKEAYISPVLLSSRIFYQKSKFYAVGVGTSLANPYVVNVFNEEFEADSSSFNTGYKSSVPETITLTDNEVHLWTTIDYRNEKSIRLTSIPR
ncbi:copper amine oxidase N-terminal domain-containing protein [Paenibacillus alginolyticus]|nr:stalk domain-containing protein [Paenibacillus alginolyticus]MCY9666437.1 copper amine oxidase N-terminal domain-containing protein [Paenibacillus alginolyticus]